LTAGASPVRSLARLWHEQETEMSVRDLPEPVYD
jgi:hypothetical protein